MSRGNHSRRKTALPPVPDEFTIRFTTKELEALRACLASWIPVQHYTEALSSMAKIRRVLGVADDVP